MTRAADDFEHIRERMQELRAEYEEAMQAAECQNCESSGWVRGSVCPMCENAGGLPKP